MSIYRLQLNLKLLSDILHKIENLYEYEFYVRVSQEEACVYYVFVTCWRWKQKVTSATNSL